MAKNKSFLLVFHKQMSGFVSFFLVGLKCVPECSVKLGVVRHCLCYTLTLYRRGQTQTIGLPNFHQKMHKIVKCFPKLLNFIVRFRFSIENALE